MNSKIFEYKGYLAAETDLNNGVFINKPLEPGQLGCVIDTKNVDITKAAKELIKKAKREGGSFADIMLTKHNDGGSSIGLLGGWKHNFGTLENFCISRDCDLSVLDNCNEVKMDAPQDFREFIDSLLQKNEN